MANEIRAAADYKFGTLSSAAALSDTSLSSAAFANLAGAYYTTGIYIPIVLHDPSVPVYEIVWITAHTAAATSVTVVRGKESTTARAWPSGTQWLAAPSIRDALVAVTRANLPSDAHVGLRAALTDENQIVTKTMTGGWAAEVGAAVPSEFGKRNDGSTIPTGSVIVARGGKVTVNTIASARLPVTYTAPFPNQTLCVNVTLINGGAGTAFSLGVVDSLYTAAGFSAFLYTAANGADGGTGVTVTFSYMAFGY